MDAKACPTKFFFTEGNEGNEVLRVDGVDGVDLVDGVEGKASAVRGEHFSRTACPT
jgi:hypothetical protein